MFKVGLTGGIAAGKSAVTEILRGHGIAVIDHDQLARDAVAPGSPGLAQIVSRFGAQMLDETGALDRARLGQVVFADPLALSALNDIVHPAVYALAEAAERAALTNTVNNIVVHDIPLLIETGQGTDFDELVVVIAPTELRMARLIGGRGMSPAEAMRRIESQTSDQERRKYATVVLDGSGSLVDLADQVAQFLARLGVNTTSKG